MQIRRQNEHSSKKVDDDICNTINAAMEVKSALVSSQKITHKKQLFCCYHQHLINVSNLFTISVILILALLSLQTGEVSAGHLSLSPNLSKAVRLAGEGNSFFISCLPFSSGGGPVGDSRVRARELSWKRKLPDGRWVMMGSVTSERVHVEESPGARGLDLVFRSIKAEDRGEYSCQATLDNRDEKANFELTVIEPISFDESQKTQSVEEGAQKFILKCLVAGEPKPKVTWNVRGKVIRGGHPRYKAIPEGLVIDKVNKADQGNYKCKAIQIFDGITDFKDMVIDLTVQHKPYWPPEQSNQFYGFISGHATLTCEAIAVPRAIFTWLDKYNNEIEADKFVTKGNTSYLTLNIEHDDTFGDYTCIAKNKMGTLRKEITLAEGAKPGLPRIEIISISHERAILRIEENKSEMFLDIIGFRVEVKLKMQEWQNATVLEFSKSNDSLYTIEDLHPKTLYLVRAQARNLAGFSDSSNIIFLRTKDPHMAGTLRDSNAINVASSFHNTCVIAVVLYSVISFSLNNGIAMAILCPNLLYWFEKMIKN